MNITAARKGRERTCNQCGAVFRSLRSNALYCSTPCRKRAGRGTAATGGPKAGPANWPPIPRTLHLAGYVGKIGPLSTRSTEPAVYALLVDADTAHRELAHQFDRRGWGLVSREEFDSSLRAAAIRGFNTRSPEAVEDKRWKDRQRQRMARAA